MNLYLLNENLERVAKISTFTSLIWVRRYNESGEFDLHINANAIDVSIFKEDCFLVREDDETVMVIEKIELPEDAENGDYITVSGRSAECLLERRVNMTRLPVGPYVSVYSAIYPMLSLNVLETAGPIRALPLIHCETSPLADEPVIIASERYGDEVYKNITEITKSAGVGFALRLASVNGVRRLCFTLYKGVDRSKRQVVVPRVTFTQEFGNLINASYELDVRNEKNVAYISGQGEGDERKSTDVGNTVGLGRKEMWVDARDLAPTYKNAEGQEITMSDAEYKEALAQRGLEKLEEHKVVETLDFEIDITRTFKYKEDFNVGDIVTGINKYKMQADARIVEMLENFDSNGYKVVPKMEGVEQHV